MRRFRLHFPAVLALAQVFPTASAARAAETRAGIFPYAVHERTLDNGLRVLVVPTDHPGVLSYYTVVRTGSRNEVEPGKSGFAHFFEHMMFRGTKKHSADEFNDILSRMGADNNAFTSDDQTVYHTTATASALETIMEMESDRFMNLEYQEPAFQKEARAVLGEYNKNASSPFLMMEEKLMDTAFTTHTYKHTTMGFLKDIEDMPNQYAYSLQFFDRYYRPENCVVLMVGEVEPARAFELASKYYSGWKRGGPPPEVPQEPPQEQPRSVALTWPNPTLPYLVMAWKAPAFSATRKRTPALDLLSQIYFGPTSELYKRLVIEEQRVEWIEANLSDHRDPHLFSMWTRIKSREPADLEIVKKAVLATLEQARTASIDPERLSDVKSNLKYRVAMRLDSTDGIAGQLAHFLSLTGDWRTMNELYATYDSISEADIREAASHTFVDSGLTTLTLVEEVKR